MIIFGTTTINTTMNEGVFHCPRCSSEQNFRHRKANGFFTLYFIPIIPIGSRGTFVECSSCGGTYSDEVLSYDPEQDALETKTTVFRMLISFMVANRKTDSDYVFACQRACSSLLGYDITQEVIEHEVLMAQQANQLNLEFVRRESGDFNLEGKILILKAAKQIAAGRTGFAPHEIETVREMAVALGIEARAIDQVMDLINELESSE